MANRFFKGFCLAGAVVLAALAIGQLPGCGGGGGGGGTAATGTLQVGITDSPAFRDFSSVHIRVDKVVVVPAGKENAGDNDPGLPVIRDFTANGGVGQDVDILKLHFLQQLLGEAVIPAGTYNQVRLILAPNQPTLNNYFILADSTTKIPLTTPSAQKTGVKIVGRFTVTAGILNTILLEFNPDAAIVKAGNSGNNNLKPTGIRIQQVLTGLNTTTGSISGMIRSPSFATWSSATISVVPRNPSAPAIVSGDVFSNFSSPSVWKAPFIAYVPPKSSAMMSSASYKVFVSVVNPANKFRVYSSPSLTIQANTDTNGSANLVLAP